MTDDHSAPRTPSTCCASPTSARASSSELLDLAAAMKRRPGGWRESLREPVGRVLLREAVDPHPRLVRGGGRTGSARCRSCSGPTSSSSAAASRSPTPRACCPRYCAAIVIRTFAQARRRGARGRRDGPGDQRAHRRPPPVPGARRPAHARASTSASSTGVARRLPRRRQQRRALADGGRRARRHGHRGRLPARLRARRRRSSTGRGALARRARRPRRASSHDPHEAVERRPRRLHRRLGVDGRRGRARSAGSPSSRRYQVDAGADGAGRAGRGLHALPARPPRRGGRRRRHRRPAVASSSSRPRTGCPPSRPCSTPSSTGEWE